MKVAFKIFSKGFLTGTPPATVLAAAAPSKGNKTPKPAPQKASQVKFTDEDIDCLDNGLSVVLQDHSTGGEEKKGEK